MGLARRRRHRDAPSPSPTFIPRRGSLVVSPATNQPLSQKLLLLLLRRRWWRGGVRRASGYARTLVLFTIVRRGSRNSADFIPLITLANLCHCHRRERKIERERFSVSFIPCRLINDSDTLLVGKAADRLPLERKEPLLVKVVCLILSRRRRL